jgi:hypothetical protein
MKSLLTLPLIWVYFVTAACDVTESISNSITCGDVCERYRDCFDENYDVDGCVDECESEASANEDQEARLEACDECIDDESCASAVFECTTQCAGVIN